MEGALAGSLIESAARSTHSKEASPPLGQTLPKRGDGDAGSAFGGFAFAEGRDGAIAL